MDKKANLEDLPPPYTLKDDSTIAYNQAHPTSLPSHLGQLLTSLSDRIRSTQQERENQQSLGDSTILGFIVPAIEEFIADLGSRHRLPSVATLTIVPEAAVPENAVLSGMEEMERRGEVSLVYRVRVDQNKKTSSNTGSRSVGGNEQQWTSGKEFSDWGRFGDPEVSGERSESSQEMLWWRDEDMAHRLADQLQPRIESPKPSEPAPLVTVVSEERPSSHSGKRGWNWVRSRSSRSSGTGTSSSNSAIQSKLSPSDEKNPSAESGHSQMSVTAQEAAFRQENEFGIIESQRGWAITVTVIIRA
ncbi:hypothetical protein F5X96DRAFT_643868 [Biscogniauxia mediterranea]|nr:hypothetical protein F5X96DRAFT_643868 [Biscogniauxia mediterranea]